MITPPPINKANRPLEPFAQNNERFWWIFAVCSFILLMLILLLLMIAFSGNGNGSSGSGSGQDLADGVGDASEKDAGSSTETGEAGVSSEPADDNSKEANGEKQSDSSAGTDDSDSSGKAENQTAEDVGDLNEQSEISSRNKNSLPSTEVDDPKQDELPDLAPLDNSGPTVGLFSKPKAGLFGINVVAEKVAYVFDVSSSMNGQLNNSGQNKLLRAKQELINSVKQLDKSQTMSVVLYNTTPIYDPQFIQSKATNSNKRKLEDWLTFQVGLGGTDPVSAMQMILQDEYDVVFLVSDGEFLPNAPQEINRANTRKIVINTISLNASSQTLRQISKDSGGQFIVVN